MTPVQLPEVPEFAWLHEIPVDAPVYTADQLRAYATDAVMAERARLPNDYAISMALHTVYMDHDDYKVTTTLLDDMAKAVAALLTQPEQNSGR